MELGAEIIEKYNTEIWRHGSVFKFINSYTKLCFNNTCTTESEDIFSILGNRNMAKMKSHLFNSSNKNDRLYFIF